MISELLVMSLLVSISPDAASSDSHPVSAAPETGATCGAENRRARRAAAALERRLHRSALQVSRETLAHAAKILANRDDQSLVQWQADFRAGATARLAPTRDRDRSMNRLPTPALCRALAARDAAACGQLEDPDEVRPCQTWSTIADPIGQQPSACATLPEPARSVCVRIESGDEGACAKAPKKHRDVCEGATRALTQGAAGCAAPFHAQRCTWSLLLGALEPGAKRCALDAEPSPQVLRARSFCQAAVGKDAAACPTDERPAWATVEGTQNLQIEHAMRLGQHEGESGGWVSLMTTTPAVCAVTVSDASGVLALNVAQTSSLADVLIRAAPLPEGEGPYDVEVHCAPTLDWRAKP